MKIVSRIRGGLGNQLFCYAAARRLAVVNGTELVLDDVSGFVRDHEYQRKYALDNFHIPVRKATPAERLEPFERYRRGLRKWLSLRKPFDQRSYIEQEGIDFDKRLLSLTVKGTVYLDGLWQGEGYFKDIEGIIREDLRIIPPEDMLNQKIADEICNRNAVSLHVRWFAAPGSVADHNVSSDYYIRAVRMIESKVNSPHYFLFSDDPEAARTKLQLPSGRVTFVSHNRCEDGACADLWLMTLCRHFIIANSTFSWWGAWLAGRSEEKMVICPSRYRTTAEWDFNGQIPDIWLKV